MNLKPLEEKLRAAGIVEVIASACPEKTVCYLVGGAIRDSLSGTQPNDFDFCFPDDPTDYARAIAGKLGATFFILDAERRHSRFVLKGPQEKLTCDFAPFRAPSLESDLRKRDFTINAMAVACTPGELELIDPLQGMNDLATRTLRACGEYSFLDDPLRCLKGIRHAACMDLTFEPTTLERLVDSVPQIDQVAPERIRTELARAIGSPRASAAFELLARTGLLRELFGQAKPGGSLEIALARLESLEDVIRGLRTGACGQSVRVYLAETCEENIGIDVVLKMAAFFSGYRPVALKSVLKALRFSKRTIGLIEQLLALDAATAASLGQVADKPRSRARWLAGTGREPLASALFLPLAIGGALRENLLQTELLIDAYSACTDKGRLDDLVDGNWLSSEFGIASGPAIGHIRSLLHQAEISGEATSASEARQWLRDNQKLFDIDFQ